MFTRPILLYVCKICRKAMVMQKSATQSLWRIHGRFWLDTRLHNTDGVSQRTIRIKSSDSEIINDWEDVESTQVYLFMFSVLGWFSHCFFFLIKQGTTQRKYKHPYCTVTSERKVAYCLRNTGRALNISTLLCRQSGSSINQQEIEKKRKCRRTNHKHEENEAHPAFIEPSHFKRNLFHRLKK